MGEKKSVIDLEEYFTRTCEEICGYRRMFKHFEFVNYPEDWKWGFLAEHKCMTECPLEQLKQLLREERDQNLKLQLEYDMEVL